MSLLASMRLKQSRIVHLQLLHLQFLLILHHREQPLRKHNAPDSDKRILLPMHHREQLHCEGTMRSTVKDASCSSMTTESSH